jgi:hypothetical protein
MHGCLRSKSNFRRTIRRFRRAVSQRARRGSRWGAAVGYLALSLGISIPIPVARNTDQPYPCMNHPCGCASAEQCWRHCCCTTLEQRLAWARENHVTPPDYALAEARDHGINWETYCKVGADRESHLCRDGEAVSPNCCQHSHAESKCCATKHESSKHGDSRHVSPPLGVVWLEALACSGCDQNWLGLSIALPPPAEVRWIAPANVVELVVATPLQFSSISFAPPTPPPRFLAA